MRPLPMPSPSCWDITSAASLSSTELADWSALSRRVTSSAGAEIGTERKRGRWLTLLAGTDRVALDFARAHGRRVGEIMTANPVTISGDTPLPGIVEIMERHM
jgi:CBS domain-containing protein